jgi:phenylalanyl-tRNA synthetase alpha subunit
MVSPNSDRVLEIWGLHMRFDRVLEIANATPTSVLCEAWGASPEYVELCKIGVQHMTLSEAGDLASVHGLKLPDILGV